MARYAPLFTVEVRHGYFGDAPCRIAEVSPDGPSTGLAVRAGLLTRRAPGVLSVFFEEDSRDLLDRFAADPSEPFRMDLRLTSRDPSFPDYTAAWPTEAGRILAVSSHDAAPDTPPDGTSDAALLPEAGAEAGALRLSAGDRVDERDFSPLDSERAASALGPGDRLRPPLGLIRIEFADGNGRLLDPTPGGRTYRLDFGARETYWRYLLLGGLAEGTHSITDPDRETVFEPTGDQLLPGGRRARTFRSTEPLPLQERSDRRFQLRADGANGSGGGRILVRRLPVAGATPVRRVTIDGRVSFVSDILVNG